MVIRDGLIALRHRASALPHRSIAERDGSIARHYRSMTRPDSALRLGRSLA
jgi:hypothetical protein